MSDLRTVVVLSGGAGSERAVSLRSGEAIMAALSEHFSVKSICLDVDEVPLNLGDVVGAHGVVFPALHGGFGEDGRLQAVLDSLGIEYCGSGSEASALCMDKQRSKVVAQSLGIAVPEGLVFDGKEAPLADTVISALGTSLVVKPVDQGSSVGLYFTEHRSALGVTLSQIDSGQWLIERRIRGRELTIGVLNGNAMGVVEIVSETGVYDYEAKYTPGSTSYHCPADLSESVTELIQSQAEELFVACGCRDFARIDFLLEEEAPYFLEVNTLPGLTATSLLPKSASAIGLDFKNLSELLIMPAVARSSESCEGHTLA